MKKNILIVFILCALYSVAWADCPSCFSYSSACPSCYSYSTYRDCDSYARVCGEYETACQCTDPNAYNNPCLPPDKFCEAFGNVGAR